jgi:hypothetical protein
MGTDDCMSNSSTILGAQGQNETARGKPKHPGDNLQQMVHGLNSAGYRRDWRSLYPFRLARWARRDKGTGAPLVES